MTHNNLSKLTLYTASAALIYYAPALAADVTNFSEAAPDMTNKLKTTIITWVTNIWGILAIIMLANIGYQGYQKRIAVEEIVTKAIWISIIGFVPAIANFLVNLGATATGG